MNALSTDILYQIISKYRFGALCKSTLLTTTLLDISIHRMLYLINSSKMITSRTLMNDAVEFNSIVLAELALSITPDISHPTEMFVKTCKFNDKSLVLKLLKITTNPDFMLTWSLDKVFIVNVPTCFCRFLIQIANKRNVILKHSGTILRNMCERGEYDNFVTILEKSFRDNTFQRYSDDFTHPNILLKHACKGRNMDIINHLIMIGARDFTAGFTETIRNGWAEGTQYMLDVASRYEICIDPTESVRYACSKKDEYLIKYLFLLFPGERSFAAAVDQICRYKIYDQAILVLSCHINNCKDTNIVTNTTNIMRKLMLSECDSYIVKGYFNHISSHSDIFTMDLNNLMCTAVGKRAVGYAKILHKLGATNLYECVKSEILYGGDDTFIQNVLTY